MFGDNSSLNVAALKSQSKYMKNESPFSEQVK